MPVTSYKVKMNCKNCVAGVTEHLKDELKTEVENVECDLDKQTVTVKHTCGADKVFAEIKNWCEEVDHEAPTQL